MDRDMISDWMIQVCLAALPPLLATGAILLEVSYSGMDADGCAFAGITWFCIGLLILIGVSHWLKIPWSGTIAVLITVLTYTLLVLVNPKR